MRKDTSLSEIFATLKRSPNRFLLTAPVATPLLYELR
jgi:hypothetical protein